MKQPYMKGRNWRKFGETPNSDKVMNGTFWIGLYPGLTQSHLDYSCEMIKTFFKTV